MNCGLVVSPCRSSVVVVAEDCEKVVVELNTRDTSTEMAMLRPWRLLESHSFGGMAEAQQCAQAVRQASGVRARRVALKSVSYTHLTLPTKA